MDEESPERTVGRFLSAGYAEQSLSGADHRLPAGDVPGEKGEYLTFTTAIARGVGPCRSLFEEPEMKISCLDEGKVLLTYKKSASLPQMVSSMLQGQA